MNGVFVTGTDTDVGKTRISRALMAVLQSAGHSVVAMKPIASGSHWSPEGLRNSDALYLNDQATTPLPYKLVNPYIFEPAIAPHIAAQIDNITIEVEVIKQYFEIVQQHADWVVVEGAGGWLVPLNERDTIADLAKALALPVILVIDIRVGCINHALLTVNEIQRSGLTLLGWIANNKDDNSQAHAIIQTLKTTIDASCIGIVPQLKDDEMATTYLRSDLIC